MKIDHIAIKVPDVEAAAEWYCDKLGSKVVFETEFYKRLQLDNTTIAIIDEKCYEHNHIGVLVDKIEDFPENGKIIHHRDGSTGCYLMDPYGNCVEFIYYGRNSGENP
jgi:catechol 2,3-dioxygenase-like lactoylglutathione lyase family enzyme